MLRMPQNFCAGMLIFVTLAAAQWKLEASGQTRATVRSISCADFQGVPRDAKCTQLSVLENRRARSGRRIALSVVVLPAQGKNAGAIFELSGGPGQSAIDDIPFVSRQFQPLRQAHDLVFVAQRGTQYSNQLQCPLYARSCGLLPRALPECCAAQVPRRVSKARRSQ